MEQIKKTKIKYHNGYLQVFMPNGDLIPCQTNLIIRNDATQEGEVTVTVSFVADISQIDILSNIEDVTEYIKEELDKSKKGLIENLYEKEIRKKWYYRILGI